MVFTLTLNVVYLLLWLFVVFINPSRADPGQREKINSNFYCHTSF